MRLPVLLLATSLAACVPAARPVAPPAPPAPPPPRVPVARPSVDWRDGSVTPGDWRYAPSRSGASMAVFGAGAAGWRVRLGCDPATRRVTLAIADPAGAPPTIRTSSVSRTLATGTLDARDPLLDAIAFSRGRFAIEEPGRAPLVLPVQAEIGRVIEDCRR